jgi:hypothetical protein
MGPKSSTAASRTAESSNTQDSNTQEELAAARTEIAQLRALLAAQSTPSRDQSPDTPQLLTVLEAMTQRLTDGLQGNQERPQRSAKIADPPLLTDGVEPTFANWKLQIQDKLEVNTDHFPTTRSKMAYVFGRTGGDAQTHLRPRYTDESVDPFLSEEDMIKHLASIYEDPFKVQNARLDYKSLMMKVTETFSAFQTRFLHLSGQAQIPSDDLMPDLFDKLTLDLQRAALPFYTTAKTLQELTNHCLALDQGLRRIKARSDRLKARTTAFTDRNNSVQTADATRKPPVTSQDTPNAPVRPLTREPTPAPLTTASPRANSTGFNPMLRQFSNPRLQALSNQRACFTCEQPGHISPNCPLKPKDLVVHEVDAGSENEESGKEEP